jgi:cobyrinic acid a,c-diamide synthase
MRTRQPKGIVIAGTHSGVGKTTVTLGIMAALKRNGFKVAPFKVGPDFIDPGHHSAVTGNISRNLDGWMLSEEYNRNCFALYAADVDIAVVEGVMGLFDGFSGSNEAGSTAQMARWLGLPVLLVVDAASMARSAAALVQGFERFDPELNFAGVLFNNLGSREHYAYLQEAMHAHVSIPCLGGICRNDAVKMPERHLGLVTARDRPLSSSQIETFAQLIETNLDLDELVALLPEVKLTADTAGRVVSNDKIPVRIGVARDEAFCFYYQDNLDLLIQAGAELVFFSPLKDKGLPDSLAGLYLGGGYPELHAARLAENHSMRQAVFNAGKNGMPIYGECGGFMYLCRELVDTEGKAQTMTGCFPFRTRMYPKLRTLGYREIVLSHEGIIGPGGMTARGHEFHFSDIESASDESFVTTLYKVGGGKGERMHNEGFSTNRVQGSYIHLHFGSQPEIAKNFVEKCRMYQDEER